MKLALIRRQFAATGGAELYLQRLMEGLLTRSHELHLFCEQWSNAPAGIKVHELGRSGGRSTAPVRFADRLLQTIRHDEFDCVFSLERTLKQDVYRAGDGVHAAWLERKKQFSSPWKRFFVGRGAFHRNMKALERRTFSSECTSRIIVNSVMVKREIQNRFQFPADRFHLVRNGIQVKKFSGLDTPSCRAKFNIPPDAYVLLFVGSGWERKGLKYITNQILPALNANPGGGKFQLLVVGKGKQSGLSTENVIFLGSSAEVQYAYGAADLFLFLPIYEPSANVCFEALAAGLPVITTRQNGAGEIIQEGKNGTILDEPDQINKAVEAVRYWKSKGRIMAPADNAWLSIDRNVEQTIEILNLAAREKKGRGHGQ